MAQSAVKKHTDKAKKFVKDGGIEKTSTQALETVKANPNTVLIIGGLIAGGYLLHKVSKVGNSLANAGELIVGAELPQIDKSKPTSLNPAQAANIAETLYAAMYNVGTDTQRIYNALAGISYNDWVKVSKAFGERRYNHITGEGSFFPFPLANLSEWINAELSPNELRKLAEIAPEVFK